MKTITFILHGKHLHKHQIQKEASEIFNNEYNLAFNTTQLSKEAEELATNAIINGTDYLIAVGGDGTMHEVVNGVMNVPNEKRENLIVGLLPVGSGNDFARCLNLSKKVSYLHSMIKNDRTIKIDVGRMECRSLQNEDKVYYSINIADVGLGAEVAKKVNEGDKTYGPNIAFFAATINTFLAYKRKKIKVTSEEFNYEGNVLVLCLANGKYFGSGLGISPHSKISDGKFSITLAGNVSLFDYLKNLIKIRRCIPLNHPQIYYGETVNCMVEPVGAPCLIEADGELIGKLPLRATMLHKEINFLSTVKE